MSCECAQCRQNYRTLGVAYGIPTEAEIQEAYREAIKQWHPDLFENYAGLRADAEEHFKQIQIAYRELKEHNATPEESAEELPAESVLVKPEAGPSISFGGAPGCLVAPQFTPEVEEIIARCLGKIDTALAIIDLGGARSRAATYAHFLLLTTRGVMVRDSRNIVSLLWYKDLGEVNLVDKRKDGKLSLSQRLIEMICVSQSNYSLQIYRSDGTHFFSMTGQADDSVKKVIYNILLQQRLK